MSDDCDFDDGDCGDCDESYPDVDCERCGGEGCLEYNECPDLWGEDCPSEVNHLVTCPDCDGTGQAR